MPKLPDQPMSLRQLLRWAITPPQAYVVYLLAVVAVGGLSFYAGTLRPTKHPLSLVPPAASVPNTK
jgi:hypothetical protein